MPDWTFDTQIEITPEGRDALKLPTVIDLYEPDADYCGECGEPYADCSCED